MRHRRTIAWGVGTGVSLLVAVTASVAVVVPDHDSRATSAGKVPTGSDGAARSTAPAAVASPMADERRPVRASAPAAIRPAGRASTEPAAGAVRRERGVRALATRAVAPAVAPGTTPAVPATGGGGQGGLVLPTPAPVPPDPYAPAALHQLATIHIPKLGLTAPVYEGVTLTVIDAGPGHWPGTAAPGDYGNVVIGGHRVTHTAPFLNVDQLVAGDEISFTMPSGARHVYRVTGIEIVDDRALWIVDQHPGYELTIFSCHPKGSYAQRIVVHASLQQ
jgi:sortase A